MKILRMIALSLIVTGAVASTQIKATAESSTKMNARPTPACAPGEGCGALDSL